MFENKSILEIISLIQSKEVLVKEVVEFYLQRIKKYNPKLNAIVLLKEEEKILDEANLKDQDIDKSKSLFGLPLACKDLFDIEGMPSTYGFPNFKNNIAKKNSLIVDRLKNNGSIIIGKTNTAELGVGGHTTNRLFGATSNPYDVNKSAAGSSGGAGSAVAGELLPFADGTDMMGSCRAPAAYANIYGYRPTTGLIPTDRSNEKNINNFPILTSPGCFAKNPNEMAILLDCIIGSDPLDPLSIDVNGLFKESEITEKQLTNIKIGWLKDMNNNYMFENGIITMCETRLKELENYNIFIETIQPKINSSEMWDSWTTLRAKSIFDDTESMQIRNIEEMTFQAIWEYKKGKNITNDEIERALKQKNNCSKEVDDIFKNYDFLVLPSAQVFPFDKNLQFPKKINNYELDTYHRWIEVFIMSSLLDLPTITVPVGFNENGMPMGMQIIGKKYDDLRLFAFTKKYEEIFNFSKIKPKLTN
jgi:amidase